MRIKDCKNLGPTTEAELNSIDIMSHADLVSLGWEEVLERWCMAYPERINLNAATALIGAIEDIHWQQVPYELKADAKEFLGILKRGL